MADLIQIRRDTASNWTTANPTLAQGELGIETDTLKIKAGNGSSTWSALGYLINTGGYAVYGDSTANFTGTLQNGGSNVVVDSDIGTTVQAHSTNTALYSNATSNFTGNLQKSGVSVLTSVAGQLSSYTGDVNITGELLVDSYNETFKQPTQANVDTAFDWSVFATTGNTKTASGADRRSIIQWKPDGTRFFLNDHGGSDAIYQFDLSTANDFSTASLTSTTTSASAGFSKTNMDIVFSSDGQYLFGVERAGNSPLYRLTLNTAWTPSAGSSAETTVRTLTSGGYTFCVDISADGTKFYVLDDNDTINEYTFGTAYDPSTLGTTATSTFVPTGGSNNVFQTFKFTNNGSNLMVLRNDGATLYEYALSTAYTLSTINSTPTQTISASTGNARAIGVHPNNTHVYVANNISTNIVEYGVTSAGKNILIDCENANVFSATLSANSTVTFSNPPASGTPAVSYYQIGSASYDSVDFSVATQETAPVAVEFSSDGTAMYVSGGVNPETVFQYTLSTAWDLSTASYASKFSNYSSQSTSGTGLAFKTDGTVMYVVDNSNDTVFQYTIGTAWDVSTASYASKSFSVATQAAAPSAVSFSPDGTKMYIVHEGTGEAIFQYTLSTAWDVSTASYASKTLSVVSEDNAPSGMSFNSDGTKLFMCGRQNDKVYSYTLSTAYDLSTGSYDSVALDISGEELNVNGMAFKSDGSKLYIVGYSNDKVHQYSTTSSSLNDSTAYSMSLKVVQDASASGYTVTWPTSVYWPSATAPTLTATASAVDQFVFYTYDGGTNWYGFTAGQALG